MIALAYAAVWAFVFSVPWENVIVVRGFGALSRVTGVGALGFTLIAVILSGRVRRWRLFHAAACVFVLWAAVELFLFHSGTRLPLKFWTYVQLLAVVWMIWELAPSLPRQLGLLFAYVCGAYVAALDTIFVYRHSTTGHRFAAEGFNTNDLAMILALAVPMAWYLGTVYRQPILRWLCRGYLPVGIIALGLTGSRGGLLACAVALLIVPLTMTRLSPARLAAAMVVLGLSGVVAVRYVPKAAVARLATTKNEMEHGSLGGRTRLWKAGWYAFAQKPLFGYGTSGFKGAITPILGSEALVAHNSFLAVLVEQGFVGFVIYDVMILAVFFALRRLPQAERRFSLLLLATLIIAMLPLSWEDNKSTWVVLAVLCGFAYAYIDQREAGGDPVAGLPPTTVPLPGPMRTPARRIRRPAPGAPTVNLDATV